MTKTQEIQLTPDQRPRRLLTLDAVRGLAVIGMYIQHFALNERNNFVSGNTMILFMLCSGISYTMMIQGMKQKAIELSVIRTRVLARAVFIDLAGYLIVMLNGPFGVVLQAYAMMFLLALPLTKCSAKILTAISAISFVVCPPLMLIGMSLFEGTALLRDIAGGPLSALAWLPVFTAGMVIGHLNLSRAATALRLAVTGMSILIPVKMFSLYALPGIYQSFCDWLIQVSATSPSMPNAYAVWPRNTLAPLWQMLFIDAPQGGSSFELLIGTGGSLILIAAALLLEKRMSCLLRPFAKVGQVSLTLYSIQFIIAWILMIVGINPTSIAQFPMGDVVAVLLILAGSCLFSLQNNGPLESAIRKFENLFYQSEGEANGASD